MGREVLAYYLAHNAGPDPMDNPDLRQICQSSIIQESVKLDFDLISPFAPQV